MALALLGYPIGKLPMESVQRIIAGGHAVCAEAGIPIAGGHSIDAPEPIYGLVALGLVHPDRVKRNDRAKAGDVLILGKGLGVGIMSAAIGTTGVPFIVLIAAFTGVLSPAFISALKSWGEVDDVALMC